MTLGLQLVPVQLRALRGSLAQQMASAYVEAARSRGVGQVRLVLVHALPNSYGALIAILGVQVGWSMFLAVVVESTFRIPGIGQGLILAAKQADIPVVNATTLILVAVVI